MFFDDAVYGAWGQVELDGYFADAVALAGELHYAGLGLLRVGRGFGLEVCGFIVVVCEAEVEEVACFLDGAEEDVLGAVVLFGAALLDLLEVAGSGQGLAFAYGEGAIGKVD